MKVCYRFGTLAECRDPSKCTNRECGMQQPSRKRKTKQVPTREERILEHGYEAYAREEGHYD